MDMRLQSPHCQRQGGKHTRVDWRYSGVTRDKRPTFNTREGLGPHRRRGAAFLGLELQSRTDLLAKTSDIITKTQAGPSPGPSVVGSLVGLRRERPPLPSSWEEALRCPLRPGEQGSSSWGEVPGVRTPTWVGPLEAEPRCGGAGRGYSGGDTSRGYLPG